MKIEEKDNKIYISQIDVSLEELRKLKFPKKQVYCELICPDCNAPRWKEKFRYSYLLKNGNIYCHKCACKRYDQKARVEKAQKTSMERYGVPNAGNSVQANEKRKKTNLKKYGTEYSVQAKSVIEKGLKTKKEKYEDVLLSDEYLEELHYRSAIFIQNNLNERNLAWLNKEYYLGNFEESGKFIGFFKCQICGKEFTQLLKSGVINCPKCNKPDYHLEQRELFEFIKTIEPDALFDSFILEVDPNNKRRKRQLDIWIPDIELGIEYDGLVWHADDGIKGENTYNEFIKQNQFLNQFPNGNLIFIRDYEWNSKKDQFKSFIKSKLNIYDKIINLKSCAIDRIPNFDYAQFIIDNSIEKYKESDIKIGLFYENDLIQALGFNYEPFNEKNFILTQICTKMNYKVAGGIKALLEEFAKTYKPNSIKVYANKRFTNGNIFIDLGFDFIEEIEPDYEYVHNNDRDTILTSEWCKQIGIPTLLGFNYDKTISEYQNMLNNGFYKMSDCGYKLFCKKYEI